MPHNYFQVQTQKLPFDAQMNPTSAEVIAYKGFAQVEYEIIDGFKPFLTVTAAPTGYLVAVNTALDLYYGAGNEPVSILLKRGSSHCH